MISFLGETMALLDLFEIIQSGMKPKHWLFLGFFVFCFIFVVRGLIKSSKNAPSYNNGYEYEKYVAWW